jgi:hypothetical protein
MKILEKPLYGPEGPETVNQPDEPEVAEDLTNPEGLQGK